MKTQRKTIVLLLLASALTPIPVASQSLESCSETTLPSAAIKLLRTQFPSWRPKQISDIDADDQELWLKAHGRKCPGITAGHFESADRPQYAVLLVPKTKPTDGYKLIVLTSSKSENLDKIRVLDHADGQTFPGLVISTAAPGKYSDFARTRSIELKLDGIYVEWIEKGAQLYYWSGGRYHKLQVSD